MSRRDEILIDIAREEARIADLQGEVARTTARLRALLEELAAPPNEAPPRPAPDGVPALRRMFEKRLRGYRAMGYILGEASQGDQGAWMHE